VGDRRVNRKFGQGTKFGFAGRPCGVSGWLSRGGEPVRQVADAQPLREKDLGIDVVAPGRGQPGQDGCIPPPRALPTKSAFYRFKATRYLSRPEALFRMGRVPSAQNAFSSFR